jgi:RNA polymerase subunit RPABC4/transcription elongation factor Spt4
MNANLLAILKQIVTEQGESVLADPQRLKALFSDYAKNEQKEERVAFGRCIEMNAYQELKKTSTADERRRVKATLVDQVNAKTGIDRARCAEALDLLEAAMFKPEQQSQSTICSNCGKELQKEWKICPYCKTSQNTICSNCGKELQKEWEVCPYCATPKANATTQNNPAPAQVQRQSVDNATTPAVLFRTEPISLGERLSGIYIKYIVTAEGHEIKATYSSFNNGLKLFVDEHLIAEKSKALGNLSEKGNIPRVSVKYPFQSGEATIEVYIKFGVLGDQLKICINGIFVGGDQF